MTTEATVDHDEHGEHGSDPEHPHAAHPKWLQHHWDTPAQQFDAAKLGMGAFLGLELLFFSGLFVAYAIYRTWFGEAFAAGAHELNRTMGAANTCVLLFSSLTAALGVRAHVLAMSDAPVRTQVRTGGAWVGLQEFMVRLGGEADIEDSGVEGLYPFEDRIAALLHPVAHEP